MKYANLYERLVANSEKPDDQNENGCWVWTGRRHNSNYGVLTTRSAGRHAKVYAHRVMEQTMRDNAAQLAADMAEPDPWLLGPTVKAPLLHPDDETLDHSCCLRRCCNMDHWAPVSRARNTAMMQERKKEARR